VIVTWPESRRRDVDAGAEVGVEYPRFRCQVLLGGVFAGSKLSLPTAFADFTAATARLTGTRAARARQLAVATVPAEIAIVVAIVPALVVPALVLWGLAGPRRRIRSSARAERLDSVTTFLTAVVVVVGIVTVLGAHP
jgi:hypothetical protein